jgi:hypothetical protein
MPKSQDTRRTLIRCKGINKDGSACKARAQRDSDFCLAHDPRRVTDLAEWRRQGGRASSNAARARRQLPEGLLTNQELQAVVGLTIAEVRSGKVEPGVANSVAALARAYVVVGEASAVETLEREVDELRALIAARGLA